MDCQGQRGGSRKRYARDTGNGAHLLEYSQLGGGEDWDGFTGESLKGWVESARLRGGQGIVNRAGVMAGAEAGRREHQWTVQ